MVVFGTTQNMKACTLAVLVCMACTLNANAATYYVDAQSGDDGNNGQSLATPWRTLNQADSQVQPGDTVYIRGGSYSETIRPGASGTEGNYITYARYGTEEVTITGVSDAVDLRNRHYVIIDGLRILNTGSWFDMTEGSSYNVIQNCYMEETTGWAGISISYESHYNRILNNTLIGYTAPSDLISLRRGASHNVIEGNDLKYGAHSTINIQLSSVRNIVRNNRVWNPWHSSVTSWRGSDSTLIEGNIILDSGEDWQNIPHEPWVPVGQVDERQYTRNRTREYHMGIELGSSGCIIRDNVLVNNGMMIMETYDPAISLHNRIYHNTFYRNYDGLYSECGNRVYGNIIKNNMFHDNVEYEIGSSISSTEGENENYYVSNNLLGGAIRINHLGGTRDLSYFESTYPTFFHDNREVDPLFVSPGNVNDNDNSAFDPAWLHLQSASPMIDAGTFFTTTTSAGSGTSIPVEDASYFYDGWGIPGEQGDLIQLEGQTQTARIVSVDYDNNRITVNRTLNWSAGQGVSLPYQGSAPDIGAFEYASTSTGYTLSTSATHGSVTKTPDQSSYNSGTTVTLQANADSGYEFTGWSGALSGSTNPVTLTMNANKSVIASFAAVAATTYTLSASGSNGSVTKSPDKGAYDAGETVTVQAVADAGYEFAGWSGDLSGSTNPASVTMNADKSITASFTAVPPTTYTLSASGANGSVTKTPDKASYDQGETVTLTATPNTGCSFANWSGDASGTSSSTAVTMNSNKSVTANCTVNTYALTASGTNGSVARTPDKASYTHGETVTVQAAADTGYDFAGWSGALSGSTNPATVTMTANKSVTANFTAESADETPPVAVATSPEADTVQVPLNSLVTLHVSDEDDGVDADTVTISVSGMTVYSGNVPSYDSAVGVCRRTGTEADYTYAYQSETEFDFGDTITVRVNAADLNGNAMSEYVYSFETEMWAFGANRSASWGLADVDKGRPVTVSDSSGNTWVAWHAGAVGQQDIYVTKRGPEDDDFLSPIQLTTDAGHQSDPDMAIGADGRLYVVWQDNRRGNWDVYFSTSLNGMNWSAETLITDSDDDQIAPVIAVDGASGCYVAWEDDGEGHRDIYVASSSDGFASETVTRVTSDVSDQTEPDIAVDASGNVYVVWTDARSGSDDIYGASDGGSWMNVALVAGAGNQYTPALATEDEGVWLHLVWADDAAGHSDVYYTSSEGMPSGPLAGISIVDDTSGADQLAPTIATIGTAGDGLEVFVCWQDWRNVTAAGEDTDLYFVEVREGDETNVLVGDDGTGSNQSEPAIGVDSYGYPYVVWTDDRDGTTEIYHAGTTSWDSEVLDSQTVTASEGGTVGDTPPSAVGDVSVVIPPAASSQDATVTITKIENPPAVPASGVVSYEFGPSGLEFGQPVTITIPYRIAEFGNEPPTPLWYDSQTGGLSRQGITDVEHIVLTPTLGAIRFNTTHFTPYYLVSTAGMEEIVGGSGGGGGGCSLSYGHDTSDPLGYFIPYMLIAGIVIGLRVKDARRRT